MNTRELDFLQLEEDLLNARKKLDELIREFHIGTQVSGIQSGQEAERNALYQDKIHYMEVEIQYLSRQLSFLKQIQPEPERQKLQAEEPKPQAMPDPQVMPNPQVVSNSQMVPNPQMSQNVQAPLQPHTVHYIQTQPMQQKSVRKPQEYEKIFGKSFMGIFASVLIFISLIIFATLVIPYLNDTMKLIGLYVLSFTILGAGLLLHFKNQSNKFYIAVIGCGTGALYLSLLLSNLYFKVLSDIALYCFILIWAVLVKNLTRLKNLVFLIIGQSGILIATILGTILCVSDGDEKKFFVLTIFYLISSCVFTEIDIASWRYFIPFLKNIDASKTSVEPPYYENYLCSHLCKFLNVMVFLIGFAVMDMNGFKIAGILLFLIYLLFEYYISFCEPCRHGLEFQMMTVVNTFLMIGFLYQIKPLSENYFGICIYLTAIALLIYTEKKKASFKILTLISCAILVFWGCCTQQWIREHLYAYLTVIPFLLYGKWKNRKMYLNTGIAYLGGLWVIMLISYEYSGFRNLEYLIMMAALWAVFLSVCYKSKSVEVKAGGYILLCLMMIEFVDNASFAVMKEHFHEMEFISSKSTLIAFFTIAIVHLVLSKWEYFGTHKIVEWIMYIINALLMLAGCIFMHDMPWQIPTILITVLLFLINSQKLLSIHKLFGYYIMFKYTVLMLNILGSFHVENYIISISLLLFAIASIVTGFYKDKTAFRLYGLILSMISIIKLVLIDIHYDSTLQNALSFFVCGILCFIISFIYHKIDIGFKNKDNPNI